MNQHASKTSVPPSVGADVSGIETLLNRNLPQVFGEGDSARRRAAIQELYTETVCYTRRPARSSVTTHWTSFAGDLRSEASSFRLYASWRAPGSAQSDAWRGLGAERRNAPVHRCGFIIRARRQDRGLFMFSSTRRRHNVRNGIGPT